jgi:aspartate/methionine/tyrosine aminotransferase
MAKTSQKLCNALFVLPENLVFCKKSFVENRTTSPSTSPRNATMKALGTFLMEDFLEHYRFQSQYNAGESGGRPRRIEDILCASNLTPSQASALFLKTSLCDSPNWGRSDLRQMIANFHPQAQEENVLITTGTSEALFLLFRYLQPQKVALALPGFQLLYEIPKAMGAHIVPLPVRFDCRGAPFVDEEEWMTLLIQTRPDCIVINNPHNPSGLVLRQHFLHRLLEIATNANVIADEHYRFLSSHTQTLGETLYQHNKTFVTGSFVKCLGVPGLRIGWCVGPAQALKFLQNEKNYTTHTVNPLSEWISVEVLKNLNSPLFKQVQKEWLENKKILQNFLNHSQTFYGKAPEGGLVSCLGFQSVRTQKECDLFTKKLLDNFIFALPLKSMEFGRFCFQNPDQLKTAEMSFLNKGFGVRWGLGMKPKELQKALEKAEKLLIRI